MWHGAFALLERSLRIDSRAWGPHLTRFGLMLTIYLSLLSALASASVMGAPGLNFFQGIAFLDVVFMTLLGVSAFATPITEEKEEDTLGLMLMAGISPLGILSGKAGGRLVQSLLLLGTQIPFVLLAVTMGGVLQSQVVAVIVSLLAYMILLAGYGLLCSTIAPRSQAASFWMVFGLVIYFLIPAIAQEWYTAHIGAITNPTSQTESAFVSVVGWISQVSVFLELGTVLATGFTEQAFRIQVLSNLALGMGAAMLAWSLFGVATRHPATEATSRGLLSRSRWSLFSTGIRVGRHAKLPTAWINPFLWKDFYFVSGGIAMVLVRMVCYVAFGLLVLNLEWSDSFGWYGTLMFLFWAAVPVDAARIISRSLQEEVRGQTLASLAMLPHSLTYVVYSKLAGGLLCWLPAPIIVVVISLCSDNFRRGLMSLLKETDGYGIFIIADMFLFLHVLPHLAGVISVYLRWGAVALAIGLTFGLFFFLEIAGALLSMMFTNGQLSMEIFIPTFGVLLLAICVASHLIVQLRLQALVTR